VRIVLDITDLVAQGKLTPAQAEQLKALAKPQTSLLAINVLMTFGVFAVAAGVVALLPSYTTAIVLGAVLAAAGLALSLRVGPQWSLLGAATTIAGGLTTAGGLLWLTDADWRGFAIAAAILLGLGIANRSGLLAALAVLAVAGLLGASTGYVTAMYFVEVQEPTLTIVVFAALALACYLVSQRIPSAYERVALNFARMSLLMVNFGFWVGSIFGDTPGESWHSAQAGPHIPDLVFVVLWALGLLGVGIWAARANRRWVVNLAATFGAIHFYTQWFTRLGLEPASLTVAGLLVVGVAILLWRYNAAPRRAVAPV